MRKPLLVVAGLALGLGAVTFLLVYRFYPRAHRATLALPGCPVGPMIPGIDVSYYQETIDWQRVRRAGIRFAFIRLSDGATTRDARFATNWTEARRAGIVRGAYQYFHPDQSATAQADLMIAAMHDRTHDDLPPVIDIEIDGGLPAPVVAARAKDWIDRVREKLGVEPIVYTGGDLWRNGGAGALAAQPLWLAHYAQGCPTLPAPWKRWMFWQHTEHGAIPGIEGPVDLDVFAGSFSDLQAAR